MFGGFISLLGTRGTLMFSFVWFLIAPIPFGVVFTVLVHNLLKIGKKKSKSTRDGAVALGFLLALLLVIVSYSIFMALMASAGTLKIM
jgi:hypothetical protein